MWSFFSKDSKDFPYDIGELIQGTSEDTIWSIHKGKKKGTGEEVSIFVFDVKNSTDNKLEIAKNSVKRLKTLRHPSILTYLNSHETDKALYLATEYVEPLQRHLSNVSKDSKERELYLSWGIFQVTRALSFLNNDGNLRHNNVCLSSIFVNGAGEWKVGGVEHMAGVEEGEGVPIKVLPALERYGPPEKSDPSKQRHITKCSTDIWGLGCLIWEVYNGPLPQSSVLRSTQKIPKSLASVYGELISANPSSRPNAADVITRCRKPGGFFKNDLVDCLLFLEEIQIKEKNEKSRFFSSLTMLLDNFPNNVCLYKILPRLITAYEYGDAGASILTPLLKLGNLLDDGEYQKKIVPCVVKLFACNDRATRGKLLQQMEHYIGHLQPNVVNEKIFPQIVNGFMDASPAIREQTIKSALHLSGKLSYNNLNVELLRHFARLQSKDEQGGIRTNTTVCLGKIAHYLHPQIRQKVLISAFVRAMRDPFPPARIAGILALAATQQYFLLTDVATRVLPALCQLTIDPDKSVRDHAFRTAKGFMGKLEKLSEDPTLRESMEADVHAYMPSLSNAAATWAGWAVTAVAAKFYRSQSDASNKPSSSTHHPHLNKKPCSLELQPPSSSSISTNTSSEVPSLGSFDQEDRAMDSMSDWEADNWGEIGTEEGKSFEEDKMPDVVSGDGWGDGSEEAWDPIEEDEREDIAFARANAKSITLVGAKPRSNQRDPATWNLTNWNTVVVDEINADGLGMEDDEMKMNAMLRNDDDEDDDDVAGGGSKRRDERRNRKPQQRKDAEIKRGPKRTTVSKLGAKKL